MNTQEKSTRKTLERSQSGETLYKWMQKSSQTLTASVQDSLVKLSQLLERGSALKSQEARYFLRLLGLQGKNDLDYCYLKTLKDYYITITGKRSQSFSQSWMSSGTMQNGRCSIANISFRKTVSGSSLSDILETNPGKQYFLSKQAIRSMILHARRHKDRGGGSECTC